jgi:hypothetical protein
MRDPELAARAQRAATRLAGFLDRDECAQRDPTGPAAASTVAAGAAGADQPPVNALRRRAAPAPAIHLISGFTAAS